ncbi:MAG TPA: prepilin peptidase [Acidimicrobiales bacterium]|nr:prepilin peptidase [Acidimicrobiales bacterium]
MTAFLVVTAALFGLVVGSFLNVVIYRVPRKESVSTPRSRCPHCGTQLAARDNVPVLSWLLLRGRCRTCRTAIAPRYPLVEAGTGVLFAVVAARLHDDAAALPAFLVLAAACLAISLIDFEHFIVPNRIVYPTLFLMAPLFLAAAVVDGDWSSLRGAALGGVLGFGILFVIHVISPRGMGFGDVRLAGLLGVALGWLDLGHVLLGLFLGFLTASVVSVALIASKRRTRKDRVPFGPFLAVGAFLALLVGEPILRWYGV